MSNDRGVKMKNNELTLLKLLVENLEDHFGSQSYARGIEWNGNDIEIKVEIKVLPIIKTTKPGY